MKKSLFVFISIFLLLFQFSCADEPQESAYDTLGLEEITVDELQARYADGSLTVREVVQAYLDRIDQIDRSGPSLNSILTRNGNALSVADQLDNELRDGNSRGPLHGIPILLKDNIDTADMPTTAGSLFLEGSMPRQNATIVSMLREKGAVILGKTNLSEWANFHSSFSSSGWSALGGQVRNPYEISRNPCGSSSGSGVAASANLATLTIGTETNGSIVCPANANGVVGFKPTVGLWSRAGIIPISYTTDSAGPMTRTVRDAAILIGELAGMDERDEMTQSAEGNIHDDYTQFLNRDGLEGKRIGFFTAPMENHFRVDTLMNETIRTLEELGATIVEIDQISTQNISGDAFQVLLYEFKDGLDKYLESLQNEAVVSSTEGIATEIRNSSTERERFDRNLILMAAEKEGLESEEYQAALENMLLSSREEGIDRVMDEHDLDAIVSPTGSPAWKTDLTLGDNFKLSSSSPSARSGYPIITLPMGSIDDLPVGVSFFGRAWSEPTLLEIAYSFEQNTDHRLIPQFKP
ncbi:amidase [Rhodohalobacter sp. SW132]|uniref:amidase n=1 Tax=Rhodohalobacter sp. SW132 TaxID=2293433 RepID=UPI000E2845DB|nr:amidase [Rhodohalobacter sp. SW132]REL38716.1 amidase [Rhodohalobacter sp. SW132]